MTETAGPISTPLANSPSTAHLVHDLVVDWLRNEVGMTLRQVDHQAPLLELGIDSLGVASISCELERATCKKINTEVVYDLESIQEFADYLDSLPVQEAEAEDMEASAAQPPTVLPMPGEAIPGKDPIEYYERLNRRIRGLKHEGMYFFEPEISEHDGAWVVADGQRMLMLSSYEYLGLLGHQHLRATAIDTLDKFGTGHHGARLLVGTTSIHKRLEAKLASFMDAEDAIVFSSGYVANLATISALVGPGDYIVGDALNHASIVDGCRMSGADFCEFRHNDIDHLAELLQQTGDRRALVIVDSVYSMEGDIAKLPEICGLCKQHEVLLMVDEAHSLGVLGDRGAGAQEHFDLAPNAIDIKMGTLSKTLAGSGGFVAGREELITYLRHHARGYIFSGALPACQASVSIAALEVLEQQPELVGQLWENVKRYHGGLKQMGFDLAGSETPIVPIMSGDIQTTLEMTKFCRAEGLLVVPVCFPAVPMDAPRLRTSVSAVHSSDDIDFALDVLQRAGRQAKLIA